MAEGETWYLVSRAWYRRWEKAVRGEVDKDGSVEEKDLGPVDNRPLLDEYDNLIADLVEEVNVHYVPGEAWQFFLSWYGQAQHTIARAVILQGTFQKTARLELYPPRLKTFMIMGPNAVISGNEPIVYTTVSTRVTFSQFKLELAHSLSLDCNDPTSIRVHRLDLGEEELSDRRISSANLAQYSPQVVHHVANQSMDDELVETKAAYAVELKSLSGDWLVSSFTQVDEPSTPPKLFGNNDGFFERYNSKSSYSPASPASALSSPIKPPVPRRVVQPGTLGLGNMGNTCFMNSALQCLAHNKELSDYFLTGVYKNELNPDNPLGMQGAIAESFGALLHRIWDASGTSTSYSPREFKQVLQRFAPQFSGYQQHDSQELVAFLLDGLHEDLNRVIKKPYVEKPDWEGGGDLAIVEHARKSWDGYMLRNDSVIVDLFQGQYMSTLVCPECEKVSITFDPFMYLTLPLPVQKKWRHPIFYVPWDSSKPHLKIPVEVSINSSFKEVRSLLGRWLNVPADNLLTLEIWSHKFYKNLDDNVLVTDTLDNDKVVCFELPCHAQQSRTYKKADSDPLILPVNLSDVMSNQFKPPPFRSNLPIFGYPCVVVIGPEEAKSPEAIYNAIIERLERFTVNARDFYTWEAIDDQIDPSLLDSSSVGTVTEIIPNGSIDKVEVMEEDDITDEKRMEVDELPTLSVPSLSSVVFMDPRRVGTKKELFTITLQKGHGGYGSVSGPSNPMETLEQRAENSESLLQPEDMILCQFDENMKAYYFGEHGAYEHALWDKWETFTHPEYAEAVKASSAKKNTGITLQDCLNEFVKEEKLGEDDLWYCPSCKKHQQAMKKFDLWNAPDILVVHLKRFSNSRALRDKIDTFVDFPTEGLDLGEMVMERRVASRLAAAGENLEELGLGDTSEPLVYDLFAVDEHLGGLGGGHYRAYGLNHENDQWYHFDDSHVTPASASDSVNSNAYLLFYRRRTAAPLGGKTHEKVVAAKSQANSQVNSQANSDDELDKEDIQLPTPPSEDSAFLRPVASNWRSPTEEDSTRSTSHWFRSVRPPSPADEENYSSSPFTSDPITQSNRQYDFPNPSSRASPSSSIAADVGDQDDLPSWETSQPSSFDHSPDLPALTSAVESPAGGTVFELDSTSAAADQQPPGTSSPLSPPSSKHV